MQAHFSPEEGWMLRVAETGAILRRYFALKKALVRTGAGWLPRLPTFQMKGDLARHVYLDAKAMEALEQRLFELSYGRREPFAAPDSLEPFLDLLPRAADAPEFLAGVYLTVRASLARAYREHLAKTDPLFDWPTIDVLEPLLRNEEAQVQWARSLLHGLMLPAEKKRELTAWQGYLEGELAKAGDVLGNLTPRPPSLGARSSLGKGETDPQVGSVEQNVSDVEGLREEELPPGQTPPSLPRLRGESGKGGGGLGQDFASRPPYQLPDSITFEDMPHHTFDADAGSVPPDYHMIYAYYQEIDIVDLLATMLWDSPRDMPVAYYVDFSRQMWDEVRHTTMGIRRLRELGVDLKDCGAPTGRYAAFRKMDLLERMGFLTQVGEACSLAGKRDHIKKYLENDDIVSAAQIEYDIADESSHVRFGSKWIPELLKRDNDPRKKSDIAKAGHRAFRRHTAELRQQLGLEVPEGWLSEFEGCEDVRDPARSF